MNQQYQQTNSNFGRYGGTTGIGKGVGAAMGGYGNGQHQKIAAQQFAAEDDDFEDDDFGDVDEHQDHDLNQYKQQAADGGVSGRDDFNQVENKLMQHRNLNPPSQRQHIMNRGSNASQHPQYSFGGQSFNQNMS